MARCVPYLSGAAKFISSQNSTNQRPIWVGESITPFNVFLYSQYCSKVLIRRSGAVALEKFNPTTSNLWKLP